MKQHFKPTSLRCHGISQFSESICFGVRLSQSFLLQVFHLVISFFNSHLNKDCYRDDACLTARMLRHSQSRSRLCFMFKHMNLKTDILLLFLTLPLMESLAVVYVLTNKFTGSLFLLPKLFRHLFLHILPQM